ncbi:Tim44/TimA family putative adaptor protein [Actibacterium sp. 188UL27-1]|uniref:Tim44/TimA family putative adaptor protein n=1 Tax=Actibacterium sp. 188UL27-1 TaxID=2786961 RepID=UPI00195AE809|nr:Tim44/TimA family putative adaptor protein [Actibacterium sp. 188UL27-1]MBM7067241.1 Tim44 domain-containing protein [Actibacterium sp. 188UL27-1]
MNSAVIQLLVLAGIAIFLILRLRSVLGTREGFEKPPSTVSRSVDASVNARRDFEVIEGGVDRDITDHVEDGSDSAKALAAMKLTDPSFVVSDFLHGARGAYEMILMAFESGELDDIKPFLGEDVFQTFVDVVAAREDQGLKVEANFVGIREIGLHDATFDRDTNTGEVSVKFVGELTSVVRDSEGEIIEGDPNEIKRQRDIWTFARQMTGDDPNWVLVATGE